MGEWATGNALSDGADDRGWLIGHFTDPGSIRRSEAVEVKWAFHPKGEERSEWVTGETCTTLLVLVSGTFRIDLSRVPGRWSIRVTTPCGVRAWTTAGGRSRTRWW